MRDYVETPMCANEAVIEFYAESSDLAMASYAVIQEASKMLEEDFEDYAAANDILARYADYQEELRCMMAEFM